MIPECPKHHLPLKQLIVKRDKGKIEFTIWGCTMPNCIFRHREDPTITLEAPQKEKMGNDIQ